MPCHSEIGQSKSLFLLTVALLCFQAKKLRFSHGNGHSDWLTEWLFLYNYQIREQSLSIGESGVEGNELGYETIAFAVTGV